MNLMFPLILNFLMIPLIPNFPNFQIDLMNQKILPNLNFLKILMSRPCLKIQNYLMNLQFLNFPQIRLIQKFLLNQMSLMIRQYPKYPLNQNYLMCLLIFPRQHHQMNRSFSELLHR
jgi:hypothetical protein